jgi:thiol:disulfide interchange protein DsbA
MIKRREFSANLMAAGLTLGLASTGVRAQGAPVEGQQYVRLSQPQPVLVPGKIEVIEFFWYGCPHCYAFEPQLEALGQVDAMQMKVFNAIHRDHDRLDKPADIAAFMQKNGIDGAKFTELYNSFGVQTKTRQARTLTEAYKIDGVPALGINGQYYTSGSLAGSNEGMLTVADYLIGKSHKG